MNKWVESISCTNRGRTADAVSSSVKSLESPNDGKFGIAKDAIKGVALAGRIVSKVFEIASSLSRWPGRKHSKVRCERSIAWRNGRASSISLLIFASTLSQGSDA